MHSTILLTSILTTLCAAAPQNVNPNVNPAPGCTPLQNLKIDNFNAGMVTERICTDNPGIVFNFKCSNNPAASVAHNDLAAALSGMSRAVADLITTHGGTASLHDFGSVPNLARSCQGKVCAVIQDTGPNRPDRPGWFAGIMANVIDGLNGFVVGDQDVARSYVGCGFALSATEGQPVDYATGCWAPTTLEDEVPYCPRVEVY